MKPTDLKQVTDFLSQYRIQQLNPQTTILHSKHAPLLVKYHHISILDSDILEETIDILDRHLSFDHQFICPLLHYQTAISQQQDHNIVTAIYQMDRVTLQEQITRRRRQNQFFSEQEIWIIMSSVVNSLLYLQQKNVIYGVLSSSKIFVQDKIRVMDPSAFNISPLNVSQLSLHSPEIQNNQQEIDFGLSDVYLLALCILSATTLSNFSNSVNKQTIEDALQKTGGRYSEQLMHVLNFMLEEKPGERPSFNNIKQYIETEIQIRQTKLAAQILAVDTQDDPNYSQSIDQQQQAQNIDILQQQIKKQINEYEQAKHKYLDQSILKQRHPSTHYNSKSITSIDQLQSIDRRYEPYQTMKMRNSLKIDQFKLGTTIDETISKCKKTQKVYLIKNRNLQHVKAIRSISIPNHTTPNQELFTSPQLLDILKQQTNRAHQFYGQNQIRKITI